MKTSIEIKSMLKELRVDVEQLKNDEVLRSKIDLLSIEQLIRIQETKVIMLEWVLEIEK